MNEPEETTRELQQGSIRGPYRVLVRVGGKEQQRTLRPGQRLVLGSADDADLQVADPTVSGLHCRLELHTTGLEIVDLASRNGIVLGGGRIAHALLTGPRAEFCLGSTCVRLEAIDAPALSDDLGLIGNSDCIRRLRDTLRRFAPLRAPVAIWGESGTGKDLVARALHRLSERPGPYVPLNVAALPETLLDAELFGHSRGAFTGAIASRAGAFEVAHRGTLFLDELAEMHPGGQAKLLRVVEDGVVRPVGSSEGVPVDVRVVSATCAPLEERVASGKFRADLFHRLSVLVVDVPPLRRRTADIPLLAEAFFAQRRGELGDRYLQPSTVELLCEQKWPGNVRQLFAALYRAAAWSESEALCPAHFRFDPPARPRAAPPSADEARALLDKHGSASAAARSLGLPRSTFRAILARLPESTVPESTLPESTLAGDGPEDGREPTTDEAGEGADDGGTAE
ncbi:MAG TPA: sigma 54-interacting transcriptional regulator [Polyangiaceae bacterium]|nr:sigma 54-interacting transcriptional regulator [Polyangiaceae bacterium]